MTPVSFYRFLPWWPLVLVLVLATGWQYRVELAGWAIARLLTPHHGADWVVEPESIDWDRIVLSSLGFTVDADDIRIRILAEDVELDVAYDSGVIPALRGVRIGDVRLEEQFTGNASSPPASIADIYQRLLDGQDFLERVASLPVRRVQVGRIRYAPPGGEPPLEGSPVTLEATDAGITLRARLDGMTLHLLWQDGRLSGEIHPGDRAGDALLSLVLMAENRGIGLQGSVAPGPLGAVLQDRWPAAAAALSAVKTEDPIGLRIQLNGDDTGMAVEAHLQGKDISRGNTRIRDWQLDTAFTLPARFRPGVDPAIIDLSAGATRLVAGSVESADVSMSEFRLAADGRFTTGPEAWQMMLSASSRATARSVRWGELSAGGVSLLPEASVTREGIALGKRFRADAALMRISGSQRVRGLSAQTPRGLAFTLSTGGDWSIGADGAELTGRFEDDNRGTVSGRLRGNIETLSRDHGLVNLVWIEPGISPLGGPVLPDLADTRMTLRRVDDDWSVRGNTGFRDTGVALAFSATVTGPDGPIRGTLDSTNPLPLTELVRLLRRSGGGLPDGFTVSHGSASVNGEFDFGSGTPSLLLTADLRDAAMEFGDYALRDVDLQGRWQLLPLPESTTPARLRVGALEYGVKLSNLTASITNGPSSLGNLPELRIPWFRAELFDGQISGGPVTLDLNQPRADFDIVVENMDISRILDTQNIEGLRATGRVDGTLPLSIDTTGVRVDNGVFRGMQPGTINYRVTDEQAASLSTPLTDVVIQALRDFRYDILTATANYRPDGTLGLDFHIEGTSPELGTSRPVHLNINSEQNVLSLLRSLNYAEGLNQSLDRRIREQYD